MVLVLLIMVFLCNKGVTYASDTHIDGAEYINYPIPLSQRKFCTYTCESSLSKETPAEYCWFNKTHEKVLKITSISIFDYEYWNIQCVDEIDQLLFKDQNHLPYKFEEITKVQCQNVYVMGEEYKGLQSFAALQVEKRLLYVEKQYGDGKMANELYTAVVNRIKTYQEFLLCVVKYAHPCVGVIIPMSAVLCIRLLACCPIAPEVPCP